LSRVETQKLTPLFQLQVLTFPPEVIPHLSEGLYLFVPHVHKSQPASEAIAYLFIWTPESTFVNATRNSPYCSLYRYMLELASDVIHVFDATALANFDTGVRPFGRAKRKQFVSCKLVGKTEAETDIHFDSSEPTPCGMELTWPKQTGEKAQLAPAKLNCCFLIATPRPPTQLQKPEKLSIFLFELKEQLHILFEQYSLVFAR
jgi:hypothetical protein